MELFIIIIILNYCHSFSHWQFYFTNIDSYDYHCDVIMTLYVDLKANLTGIEKI